MSIFKKKISLNFWDEVIITLFAVEFYLCCYYYNALAVVPSSLLQVSVSLGGLQRLSDWTLYLIYLLFQSLGLVVLTQASNWTGLRREQDKISLDIDNGTWTICPCRLNKGFSSKFPEACLINTLEEGHRVQCLKHCDNKGKDISPTVNVQGVPKVIWQLAENVHLWNGNQRKFAWHHFP